MAIPPLDINKLKNKLIFLGPNINQPLAISFKITTTLSSELKKRRTSKKFRIFYPNQMVTIDEIIALYGEINIKLQDPLETDKNKVLFEKYKSCLMKTIVSYLNRCRFPQIKPKAPPEKKPSNLLQWLKIGGLLFLSILSLFQGTLSSLLGASQLLTTLIPGIGNAWLIGITLAITAINIVLFVAFQMDLLKTRFGVSANSKAADIITSQSEQIDHVSHINALITDSTIVSQHTQAEYLKLTQLTKKFNRDINEKKSLYQEYQEHPIKKVLRLGITFCGAVLFSLSSYFVLITMLAAVAPLLVGTPLGWGIIGTFIVTGLIFYFASQNARMVDMFNVTFSLFNQVKDKLSHFIHKSDHDLNCVLRKKNVFSTDEEKEEKKKRFDKFNDNPSCYNRHTSHPTFFHHNEPLDSETIFVSVKENGKRYYSI